MPTIRRCWAGSGRRWIGGERLTDEPDVVETRMAVEGGPVLDLCFVRVPESASEPPRLHVDVSGGTRQAEEVERLLGLGARHLDIGQGDVPWVVLADPEGNPLCVMEERAAYAGSGPIAALPLDSADPERDAEFWAWLSGWTDVPGAELRSAATLVGARTRPRAVPRAVPEERGQEPDAPRHPARGQLTTSARSRRASPSEAGAGSRSTGASLPWRTYTDPSGNEFCPAAGAGVGVSQTGSPRPRSSVRSAPASVKRMRVHAEGSGGVDVRLPVVDEGQPLSGRPARSATIS